MTRHRTAKTQTVKSQAEGPGDTFGQRVEFARKKVGLTKEGLEKRAGLAKGYVSRITRDVQGGKRPGAGTAEALARALGVDASWLLSGVGRGPGEAAERNGNALHLVPRRPHLDAAASLMRRDGLVTAAVEAHVRDATTRLGELDVATWIHILTDIQRRA